MSTGCRKSSYRHARFVLGEEPRHQRVPLGWDIGEMLVDDPHEPVFHGSAHASGSTAASVRAKSLPVQRIGARRCLASA